MATSDPPHLTEKESRSVTALGPIQESPQPALAIERLVSLDAFRGFIMFWIIGGEALARKSGRASRQAAEAQTEQEVIDLGAAELTLEKKPVAWGLGVLPWDGLVHRVLARAIIRAREGLRFVFRAQKLGATSEYGVGALLPLPRRG